MIIDIAWFEGVVAGLGWGLLVGFVLGAFFVVKVASEGADDEKGNRS